MERCEYVYVSFVTIENLIWIGLAWLDLYGICNGTNLASIYFLED